MGYGKNKSYSWNSEEEEIASGWGPSGEVTED